MRTLATKISERQCLCRGREIVMRVEKVFCLFCLSVFEFKKNNLAWGEWTRAWGVPTGTGDSGRAGRISRSRPKAQQLLSKMLELMLLIPLWHCPETWEYSEWRPCFMKLKGTEASIPHVAKYIYEGHCTNWSLEKGLIALNLGFEIWKKEDGAVMSHVYFYFTGAFVNLLSNCLRWNYIWACQWKMGQIINLKRSEASRTGHLNNET